MKLLRSLYFPVLLVLLTVSCSKPDIEFFLSPLGEDNLKGSLEHPCRNLDYVQQLVREELNKNPDASITVYLEDGEYFIHETLVFTEADAPSSGGSVIWKAVNEKKASITGAVVLQEWIPCEATMEEIPDGVQDRVFCADLPVIDGKMIHPKMLYSPEKELRRARGEGFVPESEGMKNISEMRTRGGLRDTLHFPPGTVRNWVNLKDVELLIRPNFGWVMNILPLKEVDEDQRIAITEIPATYPMRPLMFQNAFSYGSESCWMENIFDALQDPGDWVSDSKAGKIYMVTEGNAPSFPVYSPVLEEFIRVEGSDDSPVRNIVFCDLEFRYADRDTWTKEDVGLQHDWEFYDKSNAVLRMKGAENCVVDGCRFRDCGNTAIRLDFYSQGNRIINNEIFNMGGTGVLLAGYGPGYPDMNRDNEVVNNHIHHCGLQYWMNQAIHIWQSGSNLIAHNKIHDMPYIGMVLSGMRPPFFLYEKDQRELYGTVNRESIAKAVTKIIELVEIRDGAGEVNPVSIGDLIPQYRAMDIMDEFIYTDENQIEYNEIHDVMQFMADGDAIYLSATGRGNVLRGNYIHDVISHGSIGHVIRNDGPQFWTVMEDNIILNSSGGFTIKDGIRATNNYIINIKFPPDAFPMARRIFCPFQLNSNDTLSPLEMEKNVIYFANTPVDKIYNQHAAGSDLTWQNLKGSDWNLYWSASDPGTAETLLEASRQELGLDKNSMVADPGFRDPENGDFTIDDNSPIHNQGIKALDAGNSGLLKERVR